MKVDPSLLCSLLLLIALGKAGAQWTQRNGTSCSFVGLLPIQLDSQGNPTNTSDLFATLSYMASMLLALDHLNQRNTDIISNLDQLLDSCPDLQFNQVYTFDIQAGDYTLAVKNLMQSRQMVPDLCGLIGPLGYGGYDVYLSQWETAMAANALSVPQILVNGGASSILTGQDAKYTIGNFLSYHDLFPAITNYLVSDLNIQYLAIVYQDVPNQKAMVEAFGDVLVDSNLVHEVYYLENEDFEESAYHGNSLQQLKDSGIRNVFLQLDSADVAVIIANSLDQLDMLNGEYFYILFSDSLDPSSLEGFFHDELYRPSVVSKLLHGSLWIGEIDPFKLNGQSDPFLRAWRSLNTSSLVEKLQLPGLSDIPFLTSEDDFFLSREPYRLSSYVYDSVIALGVGNCYSTRNISYNETATNNDPFEMNVVRNVVESVSFQGASGRVKFRYASQEKSRDSSQAIILAAYNIRILERGDEFFSYDSVLVSHTESDERLKAINGSSILYADSTYLHPPQYVYSNMNYLSGPVRAFGITMFAVGALFSVIGFVMISYFEGDALVKIAQPLFLKIICAGSFIENFTIFTISFDENQGWSANALDAACAATPWLFFLGHATIYSAIFCKLWRIDRVMTARRQKVTYFQVIRPVLLLFAAIVIVLLVWTFTDPWQWIREPVTGVLPPESIGQCQSDHFGAFFWTCAALIGVPTLLTIVAVWRTKDISQDLSDTSVTFYLVVTQFQAWLLGVPVLIVLDSSSVDASYLGRVLLIWLFAIAPLLIVVSPTIHRTIGNRRNPVRDRGSRRRASATGTVHISGFIVPKDQRSGSTTNSGSQTSVSPVVTVLHPVSENENTCSETIGHNVVPVDDETTC